MCFDIKKKGKYWLMYMYLFVKISKNICNWFLRYNEVSIY